MIRKCTRINVPEQSDKCPWGANKTLAREKRQDRERKIAVIVGDEMDAPKTSASQCAHLVLEKIKRKSS